MLSLQLVEASWIQIFCICIKFSSCFLGMLSFLGESLFCDKAQAGKTLHFAEFLFFIFFKIQENIVSCKCEKNTFNLWGMLMQIILVKLTYCKL